MRGLHKITIITRKIKEIFKMNIFMIIFFIFEAAIGLASTLYLIVSLFVVLGYKIMRKFKYGMSLYD